MADVLVDNDPIGESLQPIQTSTGPVWEQVEGIPADLVGPLRADHPLAAHIAVVNQDGQRVLRHTQPKRKKVCIVGYAENSRHLAFYNDPDCEIWGVNQLYRFIPRADRWFQIHTDWDDEKKWAADANLRDWISQAPCPVYMIKDEPDLPMSIAYPKAWVKEQLGVHEYFTSSIAMMLALAIAEGFEEIGIYGIDLIVGREYHFEKPCAEFYLGIAHARGIQYHIPENSALLWQSHTYGYDMAPDYGFFGLDNLKQRGKILSKSVTEYRDKTHVMQGHLEEAELLLSKMPPDSNSAKIMTERVTDLRKEVDVLLNHLYMHDGAHQEVSRMYSILELKSRGGSVRA